MNPPTRILAFCLASALVQSGCNALPSGLVTPTPAAKPTILATAAAAATTSPATPAQLPATATLAVGASTVAPAATPAESPTPLPTLVRPTVVPGQPQVPESILILTPGNNGAISSPVRVSGEADPTFEQNLVIEITDANGAVLTTQPVTIQNAGAARGLFDAQVPFTLTAAGPGRISVYSTSPRDGGLVHLASVEVKLLTGLPEPIVGQVHNETHIILEPAAQANITGGHLHVRGFSDYVFESQLSLALCGEGGSGAPDKVCGTADNVLATGTAALGAPDVGQPGPFAGDLTYTVSTNVYARLVVYSRSARDGGLLHLATVPLTLAP